MIKKILIVEDEQDIANVFKKQLTFAGGYEVDIAQGGEEALNMMSAKKYDLVFLDLVMTPVDGVSVMKSIKEASVKYNNPSVITLTNVTAETTKKQLFELGVKNYLIKTDIDLVEVVDGFFK